MATFVVTHKAVEAAAMDAAKLHSIAIDRIFSGVRLSYWNLAVNALQWQAMDRFNAPALAVLPYYHIYGTTLMNGALLSGQPQVILPKFDPATFLYALQHYKVPTGTDLPPHSTGELWYRGPQVMLGYLNNDAATEVALRVHMDSGNPCMVQATMTECGFLKTGDLGYIDDDGHIYVVDRLKELIKYKGHQRGNLVDNPSVITLKGPDVHTIHCLIDLTPCVESKYTLLAPPANGSDLYSVKYQLGDAGSALARAAARGARSLGGKTGFSVTVTGIDDGTPELKCVDISKTVIADGKTLTLAAIPASTGVSSLALPSVVAAVGAVIVAFAF
ncbi:hypothetical protein DYB32_008235 [Aphanomyces invadans]|uniref:Uncharacterized protein n=1 Tax=Aphanomyces invadans TaxID=157072 RepID=A0A3R6V624_9STRA|nr:hypothetical protein DYB32_008235 [Aphanomyces invadans]